MLKPRSGVSRFSVLLGAQIAVAAVSFLALPLTTRILGPEDYGLFALLSAISGLGLPIAYFGGAFLFGSFYLKAEPMERSRMVSTVLWMGLVAFTLFSVGVLGFWPVLRSQFSDLSELPERAVGLVLLGGLLSYPWVVASDILILEKRSGLIAVLILSQGFVSAGSTLYGLYMLDLGREALWWSAVATGSVGLLGSMVAFPASWVPQIRSRWVLEAARIWTFSAPATLAEQGHPVIERNVLAATLGLHDLGIYTHSQRYQGLVATVISTLKRVVWPMSLEEARDINSDFARTRAAWDLAFATITAAGIFFAFLGRPLIGVLTNGKFVESAPLVALWMIYLILQSTGRPQQACFFAVNANRRYSLIQIFSVVFGSASLFVFVPAWGLRGAFLSLLLQQVCFRICIQVLLPRRVPFGDGYAIVGAAIILGCIAIDARIADSGVGQLTAFLLASVGFAAIFGRRLLGIRSLLFRRTR